MVPEDSSVVSPVHTPTRPGDRPLRRSRSDSVLRLAKLDSSRLAQELESAVLTAQEVRRCSTPQGSAFNSPTNPSTPHRIDTGTPLASPRLSTSADSPNALPDPHVAMSVLANIGTVTNLRGYDQDELLRIANLNELHDNDAISHIKVISHAASVMLFSMFFPLLVPICFIGLFVDLIAEMVGMLNVSKYTVLPYTGPASIQAWRWAMTVSQYLSIPVVFSYFSFVILEMLQCEVWQASTHLLTT